MGTVRVGVRVREENMGRAVISNTGTVVVLGSGARNGRDNATTRSGAGVVAVRSGGGLLGV